MWKETVKKIEQGAGDKNVASRLIPAFSFPDPYRKG